MIVISKITNKTENDFYRHLALLSFPQLPTSSVFSQEGYDLSLVTNTDWIFADAEPWLYYTCELAGQVTICKGVVRQKSLLFFISAHSVILYLS